MSIRTGFVAAALAVTAVLGGASVAAAGEKPQHDHGSGAAGYASYLEKAGFAVYHNLGGPAGITHAAIGGYKKEGELGFIAW